jgi:subfamily B ATP-binding cassette protein MsbA
MYANFGRASIFSVFQAYLYARISGSAIQDIRKDLFNHLQSLSISYYQKNKIGNIIALFISDISTMRGLYTSTIVRLLTDAIRFVVLVVVMYLIHPSLTLIALLCLPFYGFFMKIVGKPIRRASREVQENRAEAIAGLQEKISGIREIKAFVQQEAQSLSMLKQFRSLFKSRIRLSVIRSLASISGLVSAIGLIFVIWFGGKDVINGTLQVGVFIAFLGYMGRLFDPVNTFLSINTNIHAAMGAASRVFKVFDISPAIRIADNPKRFTNLIKQIEFRNVSFSYAKDSERVIDNFSLKISPGESVALVGSSGSGKTTLAMLLLRFYDQTKGSILFDGCDLRELDLDWFRGRVGIVFQDPFLFNLSVKENITFGYSDASEEEIEIATRAAYALDFIKKLPNGFDTIIGERGVSLSGGQQQRLAIARAIIKKPDLVILDEATSALDTESEYLVQKAMEHLLEKRTSIIIAHRISTVRNVDNIIVLKNGRIAEKGTYKELMEKKGRFWQLQNAFSE